MNFTEFKDCVVKTVEEELDITLCLQEFKSNNTSYIGAYCAGIDDTPIPVVNISSLYERYKAGASIQELVDSVSEILNVDSGFSANTEWVENYEKIKPYLFTSICSLEANGDYLSDIPYTPVEDMAVIYKIKVPKTGTPETFNAITVTNALLEIYNISKEKLHEDAMRNATRLMPAKVKTLISMISELMGDEAPDGPDDVYVITNHEQVNGASAMLYPGVLDSICERLDTDKLAVLPSSVHEVIVLPASNAEANALATMVREINASAVAARDKLTDAVYSYVKGGKITKVA